MTTRKQVELPGASSSGVRLRQVNSKDPRCSSRLQWDRTKLLALDQAGSTLADEDAGSTATEAGEFRILRLVWRFSFLGKSEQLH